MATYEIGDRPRIRTSTPFQDTAGTALDPDVVKFEVLAPHTAMVAYTYLTDANVTKIATGDYACDIDVDIAGDWYYYIIGEQSDGENRAASQGSFAVRAKATS